MGIGLFSGVIVDQEAGLRFSAFNQRTTPEINGSVSRVAADITVDQRTGQSYYTIDIAIEPKELARLGQVKLVPGMPVESFCQDTRPNRYFVFD